MSGDQVQKIMFFSSCFLSLMASVAIALAWNSFASGSNGKAFRVESIVVLLIAIGIFTVLHGASYVLYAKDFRGLSRLPLLVAPILSLVLLVAYLKFTYFDLRPYEAAKNIEIRLYSPVPVEHPVHLKLSLSDGVDFAAKKYRLVISSNGSVQMDYPRKGHQYSYLHSYKLEDFEGNVFDLVAGPIVSHDDSVDIELAVKPKE